MRKTQIAFNQDGRHIRFTNFADEESIQFETRAHSLIVDASFEQHLFYATKSKREFYLLQIEDEKQKPLFHACVYVARPKLLRFFGMATAPGLGRGATLNEESLGLEILAKLMNNIPGIMTLRIQPRRFSEEGLRNFTQVAKLKNYSITSPLGATHTRFVHLAEPEETFIKSVPQKTRAKLRHPSKKDIRIFDIRDQNCLMACERAMAASRMRSGGGKTDYAFQTAFEIAKSLPEHAKFLGLSLADSPDRLLAYGIAFRTGERCEFSSAGGLGDPILRSIPYNYFIFWELLSWARKMGAKIVDMGGITDGGPDDPLQGISRFKRSFPGDEIEISQEVVRIIRPKLFTTYSTIKSLVSGLRWRNSISFTTLRQKSLGAT